MTICGGRNGSERMTGLWESLERLSRFLWRQHYHIPRAAYWALFGISFLTLPVDFYVDVPWVWIPSAFGAIVATTGLTRWAYESSPAPVLVIPRFYARDDLKTRADEVQRLTIKTLNDHLAGTRWRRSIRGIRLMIGPEEAELAAAVKRRLHARYLLYGELREVSDGSIHVLPRLLTTVEEVTHRDPHTKEEFPQKSGVRVFLRKLTPAPGIGEQDYPFEFAFELEALVRSLAAEVEMLRENYDEAEAGFRATLKALPADSTSDAVDFLRSSLAHAIYGQKRRQEAIDYLRARAAEPSASTELLHDLAMLLRDWNNWNSPFYQGQFDPMVDEEIESLLRRVADDRTYRGHDQARYNLAEGLAHSHEKAKRAESLRIFEDLDDSSHYYSGAWYVALSLGGHHSLLAQELLEQGEMQAHIAEARKAARHYSEAIRRRPHIRLVHLRLFPKVMRYRRSAILYANAKDAHEQSGHRLLTRYLEWRATRIRVRDFKKGARALKNRDFFNAYAHFDWACIGRGDVGEIRALVGKSVALWAMNKTTASLEVLRAAEQINSPITGHCLASTIVNLAPYLADDCKTELEP